MINRELHLKLDNLGKTQIATNFTATDCEQAILILVNLEKEILSGEWKKFHLQNDKKQPIPDESQFLFN